MPNNSYDTSPFLNHCFRGFGHYAYHSEALKKLSPENRDLFLSTYQESLGLSPGQMHTQQYIKQYQEARKTQLSTYPDIDFEMEPERLKNLENSLYALDQAIENIGARYHPHSLTQYLEGEREKALHVIKEQRQLDLDKAKKETDLTKLKDMEAAINSFYDTQEKSLEEKFTKNINALHKAVENERLRVSTFAVMRDENEYMRKAFDSHSLKKGSGSDTTISMRGESGIFKDLAFEDICDYVGGNFETLTGRKLHVKKKSDDPKTYEFHIQFPKISAIRRVFSGDISPWEFLTGSNKLHYYGDPSDRAMQDMLVIATLLKLSGEQNPCAEIQGFEKNPELAMKLAHDAFAALRMAGYEESQIKVIVNGKVYTAENKDKENKNKGDFNTLFKDNPSRKQQIDLQIQAHREPDKKGESYKTYTETMRAELEKERNKYKKAAASPTTPDAGKAATPPAATPAIPPTGSGKPS